MDGVNKLVWRRSVNQGFSFAQPQEIWLGSPAKHIDPTLASSGGANGHIYFGFLGSPSAGTTGTSRTLKLDGTFGPDSIMMGGDRPWLLGVDAKPYVAWPGRSAAQELVSLKSRAGVEQGNAALEWGDIRTAATAVSGLEFSAQAGFARGRSNNGSPTLVLGALQYSKTNPLAGGTGFYAYRSGDGDQTWNPYLASISSPGIKLRRIAILEDSSQIEICDWHNSMHAAEILLPKPATCTSSSLA